MATKKRAASKKAAKKKPVTRNAAPRKAAAKKSAGRKAAAKPAAGEVKWLKQTGTVSGDPAEVFVVLRAILAKHAAALVVKDDVPGRYYLDTKMPHPKNKQPMFFGAAIVMKSYVSFHLMPVYAFPELLESASPELRRRMQGKSCFNFKGMEPALFRELAGLTAEGLKRFRAAGLA